MESLPPDGFERLMSKTVRDRCTRCGACYLACPFGVLEYLDGPKLSSECRSCGLCLQVCPARQTEPNELEKFVFGHIRNQDDAYGVHLSESIGQAHNTEVRETCQDGGVVTALLQNGLKSNALDGAVVSSIQPTAPWLPRPILARTREEIIEAAGSRYCYSAGLTILSNSMGLGFKQLAFVGLPCQVLSIRRMQMAGLNKTVGNIRLIVGLFCSETFTYEGLVQKKINQEMGIELNDVAKMNIKGSMQIRLRSGQIHEIPLKELHQYAEPFCRFCGDFSSEMADISLGGVGLQNETFIVTRTETGKRFIEDAVKDGAVDLVHPPKEKAALELLIRLSKNKRARSFTDKSASLT